MKNKNIITKFADGFVLAESYSEQGHIFLKDGAKSYVAKGFLLHTLSGGGAGFTSLIEALLKDCPTDTVLQTVEITAPDFDARSIHLRGKNHQNQMVMELINRQAKLFEDLSKSTIGDLPLLNTKSLYFSLIIPTKNFREIEHSQVAFRAFESSLKETFGYAHLVTPEDLVKLHRNVAHIFDRPIQNVELDENHELTRQFYGPDEYFDFHHDKQVADVCGNYVAAVIPAYFPKLITDGITNLIIGAPFQAEANPEDGGGYRLALPSVITTTIRLADQAKEEARLVNTKRSIQSEAEQERRNGAPGLSGALSTNLQIGTFNAREISTDLTRLLEEVSGDKRKKYVYVSFQALIFGKDKEELLTAASRFQNHINLLGFDSRILSDGTIGLRYAQALPMNFSPAIADKLESEVFMGSSGATCLVPMYGDYEGNSRHLNTTGSSFVTRRGQLHSWSPFVGGNNNNGFVVASSGSGKSFWLQYLILNELAQGTKLYVFENGRSLMKLTKLIGGDYIQFAVGDENTPSLNPFTFIDQKEFTEQKDLLVGLAMRMAYDIGQTPAPGSSQALSAAIQAAWDEKSRLSDFDTVLAALGKAAAQLMPEDTTDVAQATRNLIPYLNNFLKSETKGAFFKGPATFSIKNQLNVIELSTLDGDKHMQGLILFFMLNLIFEDAKKTPGRKLVLIDEGAQIIDDETSGATIAGIYRKIRKDDGGIFFIMQDLKTMLENPNGEIIFNQSYWKILLEQDLSAIDFAIQNKRLGGKENDLWLQKLAKDIRTDKDRRLYSELLEIGGTDTYEVSRLYVDEFTAATFSTTAEARHEIFAQMELGVPPAKAIAKLVGDQEQERKEWFSAILDHMQTHFNLDKDQIEKHIREGLRAK